MKKSLEFHAEPSELSGILADLLSDPKIDITCIRPLKGNLITSRQIPAPEVEFEGVELAFTLTPPQHVEGTITRFLEANPSALMLKPGRRTVDALQQSWLYAMGDDEIAFKRWASAIRKIKSKLANGVTVENIKNGAKQEYNGFWYSPGATLAYKGGVTMKLLAPYTIMHIPE